MHWTWLYWIAFFAVIAILFVIGETLALRQKNAVTLSRFIWTISKAWPPIVFVIGWLIGLLTAHFWWHWCPEIGVGVG